MIIEQKVTAATVASAVSTFVLWILATYVFHADVPDSVQAVIVLLVPAACTFIAGYLAKHTHRPDLALVEGHGRHAAPTDPADPPAQ